jgi:UDP-glucose 4-epimerase
MAEISLIPYNEAYELGFEDMHRRIPDTSKVNALIAWAPSLAGRDHR